MPMQKTLFMRTRLSPGEFCGGCVQQQKFKARNATTVYEDEKSKIAQRTKIINEQKSALERSRSFTCNVQTCFSRRDRTNTNNALRYSLLVCAVERRKLLDRE